MRLFELRERPRSCQTLGLGDTSMFYRDKDQLLSCILGILVSKAKMIEAVLLFTSSLILWKQPNNIVAQP